MKILLLEFLIISLNDFSDIDFISDFMSVLPNIVPTTGFSSMEHCSDEERSSLRQNLLLTGL